MPRVTHNVTVTTHSVASAGGPLRVAVVDAGPVPRRTFIAAMGYAASIEPFELQRFRLMATELDARLVVVETPGCGLPGSSLTPRERWVLLSRSSFAPVATRMLDAVLAVVPDLLDDGLLEDRALGVIGYSLGSSTGTAIATEVRRRTGLPVDRLVLVEPVAGRRWAVRGLLAATREEDALVDAALNSNHVVEGAIEPWDRRGDGYPAPSRNELDLALLANALRTGRLPRHVAATGAKRVAVIRGDESRLALASGCEAIVQAARGAGAAVESFVMDGTHGLWHSLPSVRELCSFIRTAWEQDT